MIADWLKPRRDRELSIAFRRTLLDEHDKPTRDGALVLAHLREFCSADVSTLRYTKQGAVDPIATAAAEGRREVLMMINFYLHLNESELIEIDRNYQRTLRNLAERRDNLMES